MATRTRGRRPTPDEKKVRLHEQSVRDAQQKRLDLERELEEATVELAARIDAAIDDSVATNVIGRWIVSPGKPDGISRQMVYKLIAEKLPAPSTNGNGKKLGTSKSPRKRPGPGRKG